jgi:hypothetical protein
MNEKEDFQVVLVRFGGWMMIRPDVEDRLCRNGSSGKCDGELSRRSGWCQKPAGSSSMPEEIEVGLAIGDHLKRVIDTLLIW